MSLLEQLQTARQAKQNGARANYFLAMRTKRPAHEILAAAESAGIQQQQLEADAKTLESVQRLRPIAEKLSGIIAAREAAVKAFDAAQRALDDAKARLEPVAMQLALEARAAEEIERQARQEVNTLRSLFETAPELLPASDAPEIVRQLNARDSAAEAAHAKKIAQQQRLHAAREAIDNAKAALAAASRSPTYHGMRSSLNGPGREEAEARTAAAQTALAEAEAEEAAAVEAMETM